MPNVTGELGGPLSGLGLFALGISDIVAGQASLGKPLVQGLKMNPRNFSKVTYNRFFTYKMVPRIFTFDAERLSRESLDTSPYYTEIGKGETLKWRFDFTDVLLSGESISSTPTFTVYLKRQKGITIPNVTSSPANSGAVATVTVAGSALNIGGIYTIVCSVPLSSSRVESCFLDFNVPL